MLRNLTIIGQLAALAGLAAWNPVRAGELVLEFRNGEGVTLVGAIQRWDEDGKSQKPIDPKAKIENPELTAKAKSRDKQSWVFSNLPAGRYDLVIVKKDRIRVEGYHYPPILEFDPFFPPTGKEPEKKERKLILKDIARGQHYENKVEPLALAGDNKQVRVLVQLVRDQPTSYDAEAGFAVATVRHEIWQYSYRYGGWSKERSTRVLDRILLPRDELHRWTWVWEPRLGGVEIGSSKPVHITYELPHHFEAKTAHGLFPE